ncbi:hydantoinase/oxoprolinase family protein [Methanocorpusculum vombati]|uniref:H4MPT-linked C1 transfer pathway protein n=1 Tax=Methanocorpusculum vombati TaxID=3002864 RepID=A0ABT4IQV2_9EURY|nr:hydantoinase/oxoprolinase family protein [Methanocorpusculum vombati]MCZ9319330.1 H4MPT-linked C1 transfer pathway protein [Methanocorpusculum sp.]MCZ0863475.1 H4MPT-linked C1 transfer pathway protein [Methanocorpusculum vombati]MDE2520925.1 H4MPT-linked C1 transfer pathway protein [Methanocorpusculum sp.]MDE2533632.1 H4MPT-linked C1 transfer pathway protein [Methanocorpusculum sp.]MDE2546265.1 H4MPT-linked C1 transfer pathway protein [Methanocorpusculum sp.]
MIGIDVGGANLKVVDEDGVHIHYCPLWRESNLAEILTQYRGADAAVVMSGELADGFFNKTEGIAYIVRAVQQTFPDALFYGTDGEFHTSACPELAAANWLASVDCLRRTYPDGMMLDIGSTTADIVPFAKFEELRGLTDTLRLQRGYLVYTGMLRTPVATLANSAVIGGVATPFSTEYFACSGDAHYVLGHITDAEYTSATPDGKEVSREACLRRLARTVCADLEEIGEAGAVAIAETFWNAQKTIVCDAVAKAAADAAPGSILVGGIGSPVFAPLVGGTDLTAAVGIPADALPAFAVKELAESRAQ